MAVTILPHLLSSSIATLPEMDEAACRTGDTALFFGTGAEAESAKAVCGRCRVRVECLRFAVDTNQQYGVWGGTDPEERAALRRRLRAARRLS
jgi:WhiB family transcriptional regulator, redox-sensing transcriptional regulator